MLLGPLMGRLLELSRSGKRWGRLWVMWLLKRLYRCRMTNMLWGRLWVLWVLKRLYRGRMTNMLLMRCGTGAGRLRNQRIKAVSSLRLLW